MNRFGYWSDPLFLVSCACYVLNRCFLKPRLSCGFIHGQFNDCLLIPCALPLALWLQRKLGLRQHDGFPTLGEVVSHLIVWSVLFEVIGPGLMRVTGDLRDLAAYSAGAWLAAVWWRLRSSAPAGSA